MKRWGYIFDNSTLKPAWMGQLSTNKNWIWNIFVKLYPFTWTAVSALLLPLASLRYNQQVKTEYIYDAKHDILIYSYIIKYLTQSRELTCLWPQIITHFFFGSTRVWTQYLVLDRQVMYHLSHTPSPATHFFVCVWWEHF
jgi:hypothetical protein